MLANPTYDPQQLDTAFRQLQSWTSMWDQSPENLHPQLYPGIARPARLIAQWVVDTRAIPVRKAKAIELAFRAFQTQRPRNMTTWWAKNSRHAHTLLETKSWPPREERHEAEAHLLEVGPFTVHNTVRLSGPELQRTLDVVRKATKAIEGSDPILQRVLYGPVYIVGRLRMPRVLAWYFPKDDTVYLRPMPKRPTGEVFTLIHELGHRYWNLVTPKDRNDWLAHDRVLRRMPVDVPSPKVGDVLEVQGGRNEAITDITFLRGLREPQAIMEGGGRVPLSSIRRVREHQARVAIFPTSYSTKNHEEHFADAFAMHVLGDLPAPHDQVFEHWLQESAERTPLALKRALSTATAHA